MKLVAALVAALVLAPGGFFRGPTEGVFPALVRGDIDAHAGYQGTLVAPAPPRR